MSSIIVASCDKCVFFRNMECVCNPLPVDKEHHQWCGHFEPRRKHYWMANANTTLKPTVRWPGDDEDADG